MRDHFHDGSVLARRADGEGAVLDLLRAARERISAPERWTQGRSARDATGFGVVSTDPSAVCWCAFGAVLACPSDSLSAGAALSALDDEAPGGSASAFNDTATHAEVLDLFDRTIARLEAENG